MRPRAACGPSTKARPARWQGMTFPVGANSICIHSDTPNAVAITEAVRNAGRALPCRALRTASGDNDEGGTI